MLKAENAILSKQLAVAREGMVSLDAVEQTLHELPDSYYPAGSPEHIISELRYRLSHKQPERVMVVETEANYIVCLDGEANCSFNIKGYARTDAERYAAGLREELKAGKQ